MTVVHYMGHVIVCLGKSNAKSNAQSTAGCRWVRDPFQVSRMQF
jgi:hypothetical protein